MNIYDISGLGWTKTPLTNGLSRKLTLAFLDAIVFSLGIYLALLMSQGQSAIEAFEIWTVVAVVLLVKLPVFAML